MTELWAVEWDEEQRVVRVPLFFPEDPTVGEWVGEWDNYLSRPELVASVFIVEQQRRANDNGNTHADNLYPARSG